MNRLEKRYNQTMCILAWCHGKYTEDQLSSMAILINGVLVRLDRYGQLFNQRPCVVVGIEAPRRDPFLDGKGNFFFAEGIPKLFTALAGGNGEHTFAGAGERPFFQLAVHSAFHFSL